MFFMLLYHINKMPPERMQRLMCAIAHTGECCFCLGQCACLWSGSVGRFSADGGAQVCRYVCFDEIQMLLKSGLSLSSTFTETSVLNPLVSPASEVGSGGNGCMDL